MKKLRPPLAAALVLSFAATSARANPSLSDDFSSMSQWLSHQMAQGLAFNAGETFDPPKEVKGYYLQPDVSLAIGNIPFNKKDFPALQSSALDAAGGSSLFPNSTLFPNFAMHLRMGLPWRGDAYVRFADATTPSNYKISPTMTARVQTNSFGFGIRQHFFGGDDMPTLTVGAHFNHVKGFTDLKGKIKVDTGAGLILDDDFTGNIKWDLNSYGLTAIVSQSYGAWTPFAGIGYNYTVGSVSASLDLGPSAGNTNVFGAGSDNPEKSQGREIVGVSYDRPTWSFFANGELKALGALQYRSYIVDAGFALPFDIGRGPKLIYRRLPNGETPRSLRPKAVQLDDDSTSTAPAPAPEPDPALQPKPKARKRAAPQQPDTGPGDMIFLK